ncbi:MAG: hypothetical protein R2781_08505 [Flavobacteriaceae bacterium]
MKKGIILLVLFFSIISCSKDTSNEFSSDDLVGKWQRSDTNSSFEFQYNFSSDFTGYQTEKSIDTNLNETSSAISFTWSSDNGVLTLNFDAEEITSHYSINSSGQLIINEFDAYYFNKIN